MRSRLFTGALALSATVALTAGVAVAQAPNASLTASVAPKKAGTKKKPKNTALTFEQTVNMPGTTVEFIELTTPRTIRISGRGFPRCSFDDLNNIGPDACPAGSKAGPVGEAHAVLGVQNAPLDFTVMPYVENANSLLFYLTATNFGVQTAIRGRISNKGRKLRITIPPELRMPGGVDASLTGLRQTFRAKRGKRYLVSSTGCKNRKHTFKGRLIFSERADGRPVPRPVTTTGNARCS